MILIRVSLASFHLYKIYWTGHVRFFFAPCWVESQKSTIKACCTGYRSVQDVVVAGATIPVMWLWIGNIITTNAQVAYADQNATKNKTIINFIIYNYFLLHSSSIRYASKRFELPVENWHIWMGFASWELAYWDKNCQLNAGILG